MKSSAPWLHAEPRLWLIGSICTEVRWTFMGTGQTYDVVRGDLHALSAPSGPVDLGALNCLADEDSDLRWSCDPVTPDPSLAFFYLVRTSGSVGYGRSSELEDREAVPDCP